MLAFRVPKQGSVHLWKAVRLYFAKFAEAAREKPQAERLTLVKSLLKAMSHIEVMYVDF